MSRGPRFGLGWFSARRDLGLLQVRESFARQQHLQCSSLAGSSGEAAPPFELEDHSVGGWTPDGEKVGYLVLRGRSPVDDRVVVDIGEVLPLSARERPNHGRDSAQKQPSARMSFPRIDRNAMPAINPPRLIQTRAGWAPVRAPHASSRAGIPTTTPVTSVTGPPGFEPGFEAPEAPVMSKLYYGPARLRGGWASLKSLAPARCGAEFPSRRMVLSSVNRLACGTGSHAADFAGFGALLLGAVEAPAAFASE